MGCSFNQVAASSKSRHYNEREVQVTMLKRKSMGLAVIAVLLAVSVLWAATALAKPVRERPFQGSGTRSFGAGGPRAGLKDAAEVLGMTVDEILVAKSQGKTVAQIAAEKGITPEVLVEKILALRKARLDALAQEGKITQEQANLALQATKKNIEAMINETCQGNCTGNPGPRRSGRQTRGGQAGSRSGAPPGTGRAGDGQPAHAGSNCPWGAGQGR